MILDLTEGSQAKIIAHSGKLALLIEYAARLHNCIDQKVADILANEIGYISTPDFTNDLSSIFKEIYNRTIWPVQCKLFQMGESEQKSEGFRGEIGGCFWGDRMDLSGRLERDLSLFFPRENL